MDNVSPGQKRWAIWREVCAEDKPRLKQQACYRSRGAGRPRRGVGEASRRDGGVTDTRRDPQRLEPGSKKGAVSIAGEHIREPGRLNTGWWEVPSGKQQCQTHTGLPCTRRHKEADGILSPTNVAGLPNTPTETPPGPGGQPTASSERESHQRTPAQRRP